MRRTKLQVNQFPRDLTIRIKQMVLSDSQQLLTKRNLQRPVRDVIRFVSDRVKGCRICHRHRSHHETSDLSFFPIRILNKCRFRNDS